MNQTIKNKASKYKQITIVLSVATCLLVAGLFWWFWIKQPNSPTGIYGRGMETMGVGLGRLTNSEFVDKVIQSHYMGNVVLKLPFSEEELADLKSSECSLFGAKTELKLEGSTNKLADNQLKIDWLTDDQPFLRMEFLSIEAAQSVVPDIYFRIDKTECLQTLEETFASFLQTQAEESLEALFGQWLYIDADMLEQVGLANILAESVEDQTRLQPRTSRLPSFN